MIIFSLPLFFSDVEFIGWILFTILSGLCVRSFACLLRTRLTSPASEAAVLLDDNVSAAICSRSARLSVGSVAVPNICNYSTLTLNGPVKATMMSACRRGYEYIKVMYTGSTE